MADAPDSVYAARVSPGARLLLCLLWRHVCHGVPDPFAFPSVRRLSSLLTMTTRAVRKQLEQLRGAGLIREEIRIVEGRRRRGWVLNSDRNERSEEEPPFPGERAFPGGTTVPPRRNDGSAEAERSFPRSLSESTEKPKSDSRPSLALVPPPADQPLPAKKPRKTKTKKNTDQGPPAPPTPYRTGPNSPPHWPPKAEAGVEGLLNFKFKGAPLRALWGQKYPALDGRQGRPTLESVVEVAWDRLSERPPAKRAAKPLAFEAWLQPKNHDYFAAYERAARASGDTPRSTGDLFTATAGGHRVEDL